MNYLKCKKHLEDLNDEICRKIESGLSTEIDEIFIASSDFKEMNADLKIIHENGYGLSQIIPTSSKNEYSIYILDTKGVIIKVDENYYKEYKNENINEI